jgi:two-component system OmpR family response regulator
VLLLTARDAVTDRVSGLDAGADDYLIKPFSFAEFAARLRALVRRGAPTRPTILEVGDLRLDPARHRVWRGDTELSLSPKELAMLELLMRRPGEVLTRTQILDHVWGFAYDRTSTSRTPWWPSKVITPAGTTAATADRAALLTVRA